MGIIMGGEDQWEDDEFDLDKALDYKHIGPIEHIYIERTITGARICVEESLEAALHRLYPKVTDSAAKEALKEHIEAMPVNTVIEVKGVVW